MRGVIRRVVASAIVVSVLATSSLVLPATVAAIGCSNPSVHQQDAFITFGGGYRLHGWLRYDDCQWVYPWWYHDRRWWYGEDSRYSDGGAYHNVSKLSLTGRSWSCGFLNYSQGITLYNNHIVSWVGPWYEDWNHNLGTACDPQGDASGHFEVTGSWAWDWYRSY